MKKIIVSKRRKSREYITNPYHESDLNSRMILSKTVDLKKNFEITPINDEYSKIVVINPHKLIK